MAAGSLLEYSAKLLGRMAEFEDAEPTFSIVPIPPVASDADARRALEIMRWPPSGEPKCPKCGEADPYRYVVRETFSCRACRHQFSVTSGTPFRYRKCSWRNLLDGILALSSDNPPPAHRLGNDMGVNPRTVWAWRARLFNADKTTKTRKKSSV